MTTIDPEPFSFGEGLLKERKAKGWTQEQLIDQIVHTYNIHISLSSNHRWEHDKTVPHRSTLEKLYSLLAKPSRPGASSKQAPIWNVPFARNLRFTGREQISRICIKVSVKRNQCALWAWRHW